MSLKETAQFVEEYWYKKSGLAAAEIFFISTISTFSVAINASLLLWISLVISVGLITFFLWSYTTRPPSVPGNKVGFLVCLTCSDEKELRTILEDFIAPLRRLVKSGKTGDSFYFLEMPQHFARQVVDADSANEMRVQCKAHFMIYGCVRRRIINEVENHIIELEGAVAHQPITNQVRDNLAKEFAELLPRNIHISTENDLFSFQFTSEWAEIVARYIIGVAAYCSGDVKYAENLYQDVLVGLRNKDQSFPIFRKLQERVPCRLAELYEATASSYLIKWSETRNSFCLTEIDNWLDKIDPTLKDRKSALVLKAITLFLNGRLVDEAISALKRAKENENQIWHCNMAFLYAYKGDLKKAIQYYRHASRCNYEQTNFFPIEDFINWVIEEEPKKYQLYYCLGFINHIFKEDQVLAQENYNKFLELRAESEYLQEKRLAEKWVKGLSVNV